MSNIKELFAKTREHLSENGVRDTAQRVSDFVMRRVSVKINNKIEYKVPASQRHLFTEKKEPTVYIIAGVPYHDIGGGQRCAQLSKTFNKMGYRVEHLYALIHGEKRNAEIQPPVKLHAFLDKKMVKHVENNAKKDDIFVFEAPIASMEPLVDLAVKRHCKIIYENIDNWETTLGSGFFNEYTLKKMLMAADVLVGTAKPLVEQLEQYLEKYEIKKEEKQILYLANAVDEDLFCGLRKYDKPADLVQGKCTLLYYGSLWGEWFSWDLVIELAKRHPEYAINMIGNADSIKKLASECPENIHFLGAKKQNALPAYLQHVDYALLPFERGEIGDYVSPLKIFEYISMYARVLSTTLPDVDGYPNVYFGNTAEEWESIIKTNPSVDREAADAFVAQNTWFYRITCMLESLKAVPEESIFKNNLSVVVQNTEDKALTHKCINALSRYQEYYGYQIATTDEEQTDVTDYTTDYVLFLDANQWPTSRYWLKAYEDVVSLHKDCGYIGCMAEFANPSGEGELLVQEYDLSYMPPQMLCRNDVEHLKKAGLMVQKFGTGNYYCPYLGVRKVL